MTSAAVVLVSGGLDSATTLAVAKNQGFHCYALSFDYGQRHRCELEAAKAVVQKIGVIEHKILQLDLAGITGSALTDLSVAVPHQLSEGIPVTYVPARNTVFLSLALGWAEVLRAFNIFIGVNSVDYSGYPDCRPDFIEAFEKMANLATKLGVEEHAFKINTPLIKMSKAEIIRRGVKLGVDYGLTISCYDPDANGRACGVCDSCRLRATGFKEAGIDDPTRYQ
ncbi:MAG: 7-cyano-7-deazaguanine synthase QueC [Gammaproteobacteria bacterium]|jgi:7-cyano-7-deazaguanine synthase